jgi:hypothetical protein
MSDSPGGREVDRISIGVVPDTSGFEAQLRSELDAIASSVSINVPINVDSARLDLETRDAVNQAQEVAGQVSIEFDVDDVKLIAELAVVDAEIDDVARSRTVDINTDPAVAGLEDVATQATTVGDGFSKLILGGIAIGPALVSPCSPRLWPSRSAWGASLP